MCFVVAAVVTCQCIYLPVEYEPLSRLNLATWVSSFLVNLTDFVMFLLVCTTYL